MLALERTSKASHVRRHDEASSTGHETSQYDTTHARITEHVRTLMKHRLVFLLPGSVTLTLLCLACNKLMRELLNTLHQSWQHMTRDSRDSATDCNYSSSNLAAIHGASTPLIIDKAALLNAPTCSSHAKSSRVPLAGQVLLGRGPTFSPTSSRGESCSLSRSQPPVLAGRPEIKPPLKPPTARTRRDAARSVLTPELSFSRNATLVTAWLGGDFSCATRLGFASKNLESCLSSGVNFARHCELNQLQGMLRGKTASVCKLLASTSRFWYGRVLRRHISSSARGLNARLEPQQWHLFLRIPVRHTPLRRCALFPRDSVYCHISVPLRCRMLSGAPKALDRSFESFAADHVEGDGRAFRFVTVVAPTMNKEESASPVWSHACSVMGEDKVPTLAVVFVSKPTESAVAAVKEIAQLLLDSREAALVRAKELKSYSEGVLRSSDWPGLVVQRGDECSSAELLSGRPPRVRIASIHTDLAREGASRDGKGGEDDLVKSGNGKDPAANIPLIGCVGDGWAGEFGTTWRLVGTVPKERSRRAGIGGSRRGRKLQTSGTRKLDKGERTFERFDLGDGCRGILCDVETAKDLFGDLSEDRRRFLAVAAEVVESDDEEDSLSDWEHFSAEVLQSAELRTEQAESGADEEFQEKDTMPTETIVRDLERPRLGTSTRSPEGQSCNGIPSIATSSLELQTEEHNSKNIEHTAAEAQCRGDATERSSVGGKGRKFVLSRENSKEQCKKSQAGVEDAGESYTLTLCIGHLPGTKVVSFYSSSTGLPLLPDLEDAVTVNNPHMLLLGAPGFKFPEYIQRLASVFPTGCRAGAFLAPLFSSIRSQWTKVAEQQAGPIFRGKELHRTGAVGLAVSSAGSSNVPVEAFGEFVRMSLGMPRIRGYTFIDERISTSLFFPKNVCAEHLTPGQRETSADSRMVLEHLNTYLIRNSSVPLKPLSSEGSARKDKGKSDAGAPSSVSGRSFSELRAAGDSEKLPLAPFDAVIFPGWSMPLHIYEPRYRIMVRQCVEQGKPFGLSNSLTAVHSNNLNSQEIIGTLVNLKVHLFEKDCRSYIIAHGVQRFRLSDNIRIQPGSFGLALGQVKFFDDELCKTAKERRELSDLANEAVALCRRVLPETNEAPGLVGSVCDPKLASFALGHLLPVSTLVKTRWLGMENTKLRLLEQLTFLEFKAKK